MMAKCIRDCFDGVHNLFIQGRRYDINPSSPWAVHFEFEDPQAQKARGIMAERLAKEKAQRMAEREMKDLKNAEEMVNDASSDIMRIKKNAALTAQKNQALEAELAALKAKTN